MQAWAGHNNLSAFQTPIQTYLTNNKPQCNSINSNISVQSNFPFDGVDLGIETCIFLTQWERHCRGKRGRREPVLYLKWNVNEYIWSDLYLSRAQDKWSHFPQLTETCPRKEAFACDLKTRLSGTSSGHVWGFTYVGFSGPLQNYLESFGPRTPPVSTDSSFCHGTSTVLAPLDEWGDEGFVHSMLGICLLFVTSVICVSCFPMLVN